MPVNSVDPGYAARAADWQMIRDSVDGERVIKARRETYLPAPPGMPSTGNEVLENGKRVSNSRYEFYLSFAEFPELIAAAINGYQGIVHTNEPRVKLPSSMEYLIKDATPEGEPLDVLWERITRELLTTGRVSLLCDVGSDDKLRIATYSAENVINWRLEERRDGADPTLVVVREFQGVPSKDDDFVSEARVIFRELRIIDDVYQVRVWDAEAQEQPVISLAGLTGLSTIGPNTSPEIVQNWTTPTLFGQPFPAIPIIVLNIDEVGFQFGSIPVLPLVRRAMAIYRKTADYNRSLYIKSDPQPVISGITQDQAPTQIGGSAIWCLPNPSAKAAYLDIDGQGIPLQRQSINDEFERFYQEGGRLLDTSDRSSESGEALRRRETSKQVSLRSIAQNAGEAVQFALRKIAFFLGANPDEVVFEADLDFAEPNMEGRELLDIMAAKNQGAPYSQESIHANMRRGGMTRLTFKEEQAFLKVEDRGVSALPPAEPDETELGANKPESNDAEST